MENNRQNAGNSWGAEAETIAAEYLATRGYVVRERNWKVPRVVEIDIIAEYGGNMIFVEVKARNGNWEEPEAAVDEKKIRKMVLGADIYLRNQSHLFSYRFDIIAITGSLENYTLNHYEDAFISPVAAARRR